MINWNTDLDEHSAAGASEAQYEDGEIEECACCGEIVEPGTGDEDRYGDLICDTCLNETRVMRNAAGLDPDDDGPGSGYHDRMDERRQMGLCDFKEITMSYYIHDTCCMTGPSRTRHANILDALTEFAAFYRRGWLKADDGRKVVFITVEYSQKRGKVYVMIDPYDYGLNQDGPDGEMDELRAAAEKLGFGVCNPYNTYRYDRSKFWDVAPRYETEEERDAWTRPLARKLNAEALARRNA